MDVLGGGGGGGGGLEEEDPLNADAVVHVGGCIACGGEDGPKNPPIEP